MSSVQKKTINNAVRSNKKTINNGPRCRHLTSSRDACQPPSSQTPPTAPLVHVIQHAANAEHPDPPFWREMTSCLLRTQIAGTLLPSHSAAVLFAELVEHLSLELQLESRLQQHVRVHLRQPSVLVSSSSQSLNPEP